MALRERELAVKCPKLTIKVPVQPQCAAPIKLTMKELQDLALDLNCSMSSFVDDFGEDDSLVTSPVQLHTTTIDPPPATPIDPLPTTPRDSRQGT